MNSIITYIKQQLKKSEIVEKLIYINIAVFLIMISLKMFSFFYQGNSNLFLKWFALPDSFSEFIAKPWTIVTYGFLHQSFTHILFNLIALFFIGNLFKQYFTAKQLLNFYIFGTIFGGITFLLSYNLFPVFTNDSKQNLLLGASAGISAIFIGIASYIPNYEIKIPLIGFLKLWILAAIWVTLDIMQIPVNNAGGHLAHLGGALFGFLYVQKASNKELDIFSYIKKMFISKKEKPLKTVYKSGNKRTKSAQKHENQQQIDAILDKISKSGYDTLTKEEKDFLFKQGNK